MHTANLINVQWISICGFGFNSQIHKSCTQETEDDNTELKWIIGTTWTSSTENMKIATYTSKSKCTVQILWTFATLFSLSNSLWHS